MSVTGKVNGDLIEDDAANSPPRPQRKLRLNRRSFHLSNNSFMNSLSDKSDQKKPDVNGHNDSTENKADSSQKTITSLNSVKNNTANKDGTAKSRESSAIINLKRSSVSPNGNKNGNSDTTGILSSADPPKKKHKPITWP